MEFLKCLRCELAEVELQLVFEDARAECEDVGILLGDEDFDGFAPALLGFSEDLYASLEVFVLAHV